MTPPRRPGENPATPGPPGPRPSGQPRNLPSGQPAGTGGTPPSTPGSTRVQPGRDPQTGRFQNTPPPGRIPAAQQRQPVDIATRLDGQRGWLKELDNSLKKRSIIALVLTCLAVGVGGAALYISITKNADQDRITALDARVKALEDASQAGAAATGTPLPDTGTTTPDTGTISPDTGTTTPDTGTTTPGTGTTTPGTGTTTPDTGSGVTVPGTGGE